MPTNDTIDITLQDLRAIIHGLKMAPLGFIDDGAVDEINAMIKALPGPETINSLDPMEIKGLQSSVGGIMELIEMYGKRDKEYKTRYKSRTGLPPRYKVLEWRCPMEQKSRDIARNLVKMSAVADGQGYSDVAGDLIKCAKKMGTEELPLKEVVGSIVNVLQKEGFSKESSMLKEAAQTYDLSMDDVIGGLGQINSIIDSVMAAVNDKYTSLSQSGASKPILSQLFKIWQQLTKVQQQVTPTVQQLSQESQAIEQSIQELAPQTIQYQGKNYQIQWGDADADGYQDAYVEMEDGTKYEVQEDEQGARSLSPMAVTPNAAIPETTTPSQTPGATTTQQSQQSQQSQFGPGTSVTWTTQTGRQQQGTVKGPGANTGEVVVEYQGKTIAIPQTKLQVAASSVFNLRKFSSKK